MFQNNVSTSVRRAGLTLVVFLVTLMLVACGDSATSTSGATTPTTLSSTTAVSGTTASGGTTTTTAAVSTTAAPTGATTAAVSTTVAPSSVTTSVATVAGGVDVSKLPPVELTYQFPAFNGVQKDTQLVQDELNKILKQKINATIKLVEVEGGAYEEKQKLAFAAGEKSDLVFTAPWLFNYANNVTQGNFIPLDDLLQKYAPKLYSSLPATTWNAARINGKIYGVFTQQISVKPWGFAVRKDLAEKYKLDVNAINKLDDLTPFLEQVKKGEQGVTPIYSDTGGNGGFFTPEVWGYDPDASIKADDKSLKVVNLSATPEFRTAMKTSKAWHQANYFTKDDLSPEDGKAAFKAGKYAVLISTGWGPGADVTYKKSYGFDFVGKSLTKQPLLTTSSVVAALNSISRTSANPERAMMLLELLNTDKQVFNLLENGIEGKHYVFVDKSKDLISFPSGVDAKTSSYNPNIPWVFGNTFLNYYTDPTQVGLNDTVKKLNADALPSAALGFNFVGDSVKTESAQIDAVNKEFGAPLATGQVADVDKAIDEFNQKLKAAGLDKVMAERQRQLDQWRKANGN